MYNFTSRYGIIKAVYNLSEILSILAAFYKFVDLVDKFIMFGLNL